MSSGLRCRGFQGAAWVLLGWFALSCIACSYSGAVASKEERIKKAKGAGATRNWYSSQTDDYVTPQPEALRPDPLKDRHEKIANPNNTAAPTINWGSWNGFFSVLSWSGLVVILATLLILILLIFYLSDPVRFTRSRNRKEKGMGGSDEIRVSDLPFSVEAPIAGLLSEAEKWMRLGDYSKAIVYLFSHILIELDEHRRIRLQRGKTNGMYLRELGRWPEWRGAIRKVVTAFERSFFGGHPLTEETFMECWNLLPAFDQWLASEEAAVPSKPMVVSASTSPEVLPS